MPAAKIVMQNIYTYHHETYITKMHTPHASHGIRVQHVCHSLYVVLHTRANPMQSWIHRRKFHRTVLEHGMRTIHCTDRTKASLRLCFDEKQCCYRTLSNAHDQRHRWTQCQRTRQVRPLTLASHRCRTACLEHLNQWRIHNRSDFSCQWQILH